MKTTLFLFLIILFSTNLLTLEPELYNEQKFVDDIGYWQFIEHNNMGYFVGDDGISGKVLWAFDGMSGQLAKLQDISTVKNPNSVIVSSQLEEKLLFATVDSIGRGLWSTDGTKEGTELLLRIPDGGFESKESSFIVNGIVYFKITYSNKNTGVGYSDGTKEGTGLITDSIGAKNTNSMNFYKIDNKLVLVMMDNLSFNEILVLDEIKQKFVSLTNFTKESYRNKGTQVAIAGNRLLFTMTKNTSSNLELWMTDGTAEGTKRFIEDVVFKYLSIGNTEYSSVFKGKFYFMATEYSESSKLWVSDGTLEGTKPFEIDGKTFYAIFPPNDQSKYDKMVLVILESAGDYKLMRTDGTGYGTKIYDLDFEEYDSRDYRFALAKDRVFYMTSNENRPRKLWMQYYYEDDKKLIVDYSDHYLAKYVAILDTTTIFERCLYNVRLDPKKYSLFTTDGVDKEPIFVLEDSVGFSGGIYYSKTIGNMMYFIMTDYSNMEKLCRTDMTSGGTEIIQMDDASIVRQVDKNSGVIEVNGYVYFFANYYNKYSDYNLYRIKSPIVSNVEQGVVYSGEVAVYPNPVSDNIFIEIEKPTTISLVDMNGKRIRDIKLDKASEIDISDLSKGVYFMIDETGNVLSKFVKE